jgi:sugar phosphate isomerase/epimerase
MKFALTATPYLLGNVPVLFQGDLSNAFTQAVELGCDGIELHLRQPADIDKQQIRRMCLQHNLEIPAIGTGWAAIVDGLTFTNPDPRISREAVRRIEEHIELAAYFGSAVIIGLILGNMGKDQAQRPARWKSMFDCLYDCCQSALDRGVDLFLEPVNRYESDHLNTLDDALSLIAKTGSPNLKLLADTFHMNIEEVDLADSIRKAKPAHLHLSDSNRQAPGHGHTDFGRVIQSLSDIGYTGYLSFEMLPLPVPVQAAQDGLQVIKKTLSEFHV